jgi:hypothetical protein
MSGDNGLVTRAELANALQQDPAQVVDAWADSAIRKAEGWLRGCTHFQTWPEPRPEDLWSWAVELAGLAYSNPEGVLSTTTGGQSITWPAARRREILDAAAAAYPKSRPQACFPPAQDWPRG